MKELFVRPGKLALACFFSILVLNATCALAANPPSPVTATATSCSSVNIAWPAASGSGGNAPTEYQVYRDTLNTLAGAVAATTLTFTDVNAGPSSTHIYGVRTKASNGSYSTTTWSSSVSTTPLCPTVGPPGKANLTLQGLNGVINWPGSAGVKYQVECSSNMGGNWYPVDAPTTASSVAHVRTGPALLYRVAWFTNTTEYKNNYSLFSSDVTAPTALSAYSATELTGSQIRLDWSASADTQSGMKGYLLYRDNTFLAYAPNGTTTYTDATGQGVNSTYDIAAMDRAGNTTAKARPSCTFSLSATSWAAPACAGSTTVYVTASRSNCGRSVSNPCAWLTVTPASATGSGWVNLSATSNTSGSSRSCNVTIAGQTFSVTQAACACNYFISTSSSPAAGGTTSGGGTVNCGATVTVTATANAGYVFANWTESGSVVSSSPNYSFAANANRTLVANFTACTYFISTSSSPAAGGTTSGGGTVSCSAGVTVNATANSGYTFANWTESGGVVSSSASYSFTANASRTLVANFSTTSCSYSLTPTSSSFGNAGGTGSFIAYTGSTCSRTATPSSSWITITSGGTGTGNGTVAFSVAANTGAARTGTITISGSGASQTYTVNQDAAAACTYSLTPTNVYFSSAASGGSSIISAGSGCSWTVSETNTWVTITSALNGSGGGSLTYSLVSNPSLVSGRVGKIYLVGGGQTKIITITQDPNYAPIANPGANSSAVVGAAASLDGSASTDQDGYIASYQWNFGDGYTGSGVNAAHTYNAAGNYTVTLTTTDDLGAAASANKTVTVAPPADTTPPSTSLTAPSGGATLTGTAAFSGTASDNVGVSRVEFWCDNSVLLGTDTTSPYSITYNTTGIPNGTRTFNCKAFDAAGNVATSTAISATVNNTTGGTSGQLQWAKTMLSSGNGYATCVAGDRSGNVIVSGAFNGSVNLGTGLIPSAGGADGFLAKYNAQGGLLWVKQFSSVQHDYAQSVTVDSLDNIIVVGSFGGPVDFGGGLLSPGGLFVAKYSPSGAHLWSKSFLCSVEGGNTVAVDGSGNVVVAASFVGTVDFGGANLICAGASDVALLKLSGATGTRIWAKQIGGLDTDTAKAVTVDRSGDVVVTGYFWGSINLGGGSLLAAGGANDVDLFLAKYSGMDGGYRWGKRIGGSVGGDNSAGLATDPNTGNIFVSGHFTGAVDFGGPTLLDSYNNGGVFLVGYGPTGNYLWGKATGGGSDNGLSVAVDQSGNLALTGQASSAIYFGGDRMLLGSGQPSLFIASFSINPSLPNAEPTYRWAKYLNTGTSSGKGTALDASGQVVTGGSYVGTVDFGGTSATTSMGFSSGYVAKYAQ